MPFSALLVGITNSSQTQLLFDFFLSKGTDLGALLAIGIMVFVHIKYPQNVFGKVLMWVYIALIVIVSIRMIIFTITCFQFMSSFKKK